MKRDLTPQEAARVEFQQEDFEADGSYERIAGTKVGEGLFRGEVNSAELKKEVGRG